jgi:hypothetical protein
VEASLTELIEKAGLLSTDDEREPAEAAGEGPERSQRDAPTEAHGEASADARADATGEATVRANGTGS